MPFMPRNRSLSHHFHFYAALPQLRRLQSVRTEAAQGPQVLKDPQGRYKPVIPVRPLSDRVPD